MKTVAVFGAKGFVGSALVAALQDAGSCEVVETVRDTFERDLERPVDYLIHAAMPSGRFKAKNDPEWDFSESVRKTAAIVQRARFRKLVLISSVSARCQLDTVYGRHKAAAEALIPPGNLIVRLGPMYGPTLSKGVLIDILHNKPVFVDGASEYAFTPLAYVARWIANNLDRIGLVEVGARNALPLRVVAERLGRSVPFKGEMDHQHIMEPPPDAPDAEAVYPFLEEFGLRMKGNR